MSTTVFPDPSAPPLPRSNTGGIQSIPSAIFLHKSIWTPYSFLCLGPTLAFISLVPEQVVIYLFFTV